MLLHFAAQPKVPGYYEIYQVTEKRRKYIKEELYVWALISGMKQCKEKYKMSLNFYLF